MASIHERELDEVIDDLESIMARSADIHRRMRGPVGPQCMEWLGNRQCSNSTAEVIERGGVRYGVCRQHAKRYAQSERKLYVPALERVS